MTEESAGIKKYCQPRAPYHPYLEGGDIQFYSYSTTWTALRNLAEEPGAASPKDLPPNTHLPARVIQASETGIRVEVCCGT